MQLLEFKKTKEGNLRIQKVREKGVTQELRELWQDDSRGINSKFLEACEYVMCNSDWELVQPEEIGAQTSALILSDDVVRDDMGELLAIGRRYWNPQYAIMDELEEILKHGYIEFEGQGDPLINLMREDLQDFLDKLPKGLECSIPMEYLRDGLFYVAHFYREDHSGFDVVYLDAPGEDDCYGQ